jgi:hypothetical protein
VVEKVETFPQEIPVIDSADKTYEVRDGGMTGGPFSRQTNNVATMDHIPPSVDRPGD